MVSEKSALVFVTDTCTEGKVFYRSVVVRHACAIIIICGSTEHEVGALIVHGVLCVDANKAAYGVTPKECALRATQNVDAVCIAQVLIHAAHVGQGYVVDVHSYGWCADAAAYASQVDAACQATSVAGNE